MFLDLLAVYLGAFVATFIVYNVILIILNFVTRYKMLKRKAIITAFVLSIISIGILANVLYSWEMVLTHHLPLLILIFLIDYRRTMYQKCPHCAEKIKADAIICKYCHSQVNNSKIEESINV